MSDMNSINKALGDNAKFYPNYLTNHVASDFKFHLESGIKRIIDDNDRMVEEMAELKGLVDSLKKDRSSAISLMSKSWQHGAEDRPMILTSFVEMANKQFESLAKLNQEGEE